MYNLICGERYKRNKSIISKGTMLLFVIAGIIYFMQCRNFISGFSVADIANDNFMNAFAYMLGDISSYGNEIISTIVILGAITVFGFLSAICIVPVYTSISVTDEYATRNIQQLSGKGFSRHKIVIAKFLGICEFIILMILIMTLISMAVAVGITGMRSLLDYKIIVLIYLLKIISINIAFISLALFGSFLTKYSGAAMPVNFILIICLFGEMANELFSRNLLVPMLVYVAMIIIFLSGTVFLFNRSDI